VRGNQVGLEIVEERLGLADALQVAGDGVGRSVLGAKVQLEGAAQVVGCVS